MATFKIPSVAQIDAHVKKYEDKQHGMSEKAVAKNNSDPCKVWEVVGLILKFASGLLFFKPKWQKILRVFIVSMDTNCDVEPEV